MIKFILVVVILIALVVIADTVKYQLYLYNVRKGVMGVKYNTPKLVYGKIREIKFVFNNLKQLWR